MPRVTRAALRSQELQEEPDVAASVPLPLTPIKGRAPLGETTGNTSTIPQTVNATEEIVGAKKGPGRGRKANATKKATKQPKVKSEEVDVEILEDMNQSQTSAAADEACQDLLKEDSASVAEPVDVAEDRAHTPASAAAEEASQLISPKASLSQSDPEVEMVEQITPPGVVDDEGDSFVAKIESRSPAKSTSATGLGITAEKSGEESDSSIEKIKSRSPGKRASRIEDSVEALDVLEEEIEKVDGLFPESTEVQSLGNVRAKSKSPTKFTDTKTKTTDSLKVKRKPAVHSTTVTKKRTTNGTPSSSKSPVQPPATRKSSISTTNLAKEKREAAAKGNSFAASTSVSQASQPVLKKRVSSIHKAPFQPTKSTKPPTRAVFELPGEAVARKLKEQREERLKREDEVKPKQTAFKARPIRLSQAPEVKLTATTRARLSIAKGEPVTPTTATNARAKPKPSSRPGSTLPTGSNKRASSFLVTKRTTKPPSANSSARVTRGPSLNISATSSNPQGVPRPAPTGEDLAHQKVKGKEVFGRTKAELQEREKARKEKEEAAKKARADAAERGRVASRAWAEQQRLRKIEAEKAKQQPQAAEA